MKKHAACLFPVVFLLCASDLQAAPIGSSNAGREYLLNVEDFSRFSLGVYISTDEREVTRLDSLEARKSYGYIGYEPYLGWNPIDRRFSLYVGGGLYKAKFANSAFSSEAAMFMGGVHINVLDYDVADPTLFEDRLRITADLQYLSTEVEYAYTTWKIKVEEVSAALLFSVVNDLDRNKMYTPNSIELFVGPIYSDLRCTEFNESEPFGYTVGLAIYLTETVSLNVAAINYESASYTFGLDVRF